MRMPDITEITLFGIVGLLLLAYLASWPIEWWLDRRRKRITARMQALDTYMAAAPLQALVESPALMEAVRSAPDPPACGEEWTGSRLEAGCHIDESGLLYHECVLIGGHRIHRCVCGAVVIEDPVIPSPAPLISADTASIPQPARPYTTDGMVKLGRNTLCRACVDHRTNGRYADICDSCRPSLIGSARGLS